MSNIFHFKAFSLIQDRSAQCMTTDSMVLGAVAELEGALNILDIGTGTGVLALMMAQKHPEALVDAVEIDEASAREAELNFENSPWSFRLHCYHQALQEFVRGETLHYDLILCNPPWFPVIHTQKGRNSQWPDERRRSARTLESLDVPSLLGSVSKVLTADGRFFLIIPMDSATAFLMEAAGKGLYPHQKISVRHSEGYPARRLILELSRQEPVTCKEEEILLRRADGNWSDQYMELTSDFHSRDLLT